MKFTTNCSPEVVYERHIRHLMITAGL